MSEIAFTIQDYRYMTTLRKQAFIKIAETLGKNHPITKMMGSRAWGRSNFEVSMHSHNLRAVITEFAALNGAFDVINTWARDNDYEAQKIILDIYPMGYTTK